MRKMTQLLHLGEFKDKPKKTLGNERCYEDDECGCEEQVAYDNPYGALVGTLHLRFKIAGGKIKSLYYGENASEKEEITYSKMRALRLL